MFERSTERVRSVLVSAKKEEGTLFHCFVSSLHRAPRRDAAVVTAAWVAVMLLAACGAAGSSSPSHHAQQQLSKSLMPWSAFPVNARLRPLVFVGPLVVDPSSGFRNGADKIAYIEGAIVAPGTFPPGPTESAGYPIISAKVAFGIFKSRTVRGLVANHHLSVIAVRFGSGVFQTDRGSRRLPAWLFEFQNVRDSARVLAVSSTSIFTPPKALTGRPPLVSDARIGPDDRTLMVRFDGAPSGTGPCTADYDLGVVESRTTVAVTVHEHDHDSGVACAQPGYLRQVTTRLEATLGARVVVDAATSTAVAVTESEPSS
jgi:hypothetical protein